MARFNHQVDAHLFHELFMVQHNNQVDAHLCHPKITFWLISQKLLNGKKPSMAHFKYQVDAHLCH